MMLKRKDMTKNMQGINLKLDEYEKLKKEIEEYNKKEKERYEKELSNYKAEKG